MKITFLGAAQTVTGSCYAIEAAGSRFLIDCGMYQGNQEMEKRNAETKNYITPKVDFVLLTHAHIDHSGLLPRLSKEGFTGPIYCTTPTKDLLCLMLDDSAHIQEMEYTWREAHSKRKGQKTENGAPLYTSEDADKAMELVRPVEFDKAFEPAPGIRVIYHYVAHILGAAFLELEITEGDTVTRLVFSGDLGRPGALLLADPAFPPKADYLFVESTYGDRNHKGEDDTLNELAEAIAYSYKNKEKVIIPTFAVERTQEVLYSLMMLVDKGKLPPDMPIYVDSPLAIRATDVFIQYAHMLQTPEAGSLANINSPKYNIHYTLSAAESQALNESKGPAIILSASGMCNAGRIKHHLKHNAWKPGASIVFVGYQAMGTLGRKIVDGVSPVRLFNADLAIKAKIFTINGFSAHAGQSQIMDWIAPSVHPELQIVLIHGEEKAQTALKTLIQEKFGLTARVPSFLEEMEIHGKAAPICTTCPDNIPSVDWKFLLDEMDQRMAQLHTRLTDMPQKPWETQTDTRDRLLEIHKDLLNFLSQL